MTGQKRVSGCLILEHRASTSDIKSLDLACPQRPKKDAVVPQTVFPLLQVYSLDVMQVLMNHIKQIFSVKVTTNLKLLVVYPYLAPSKTLENSKKLIERQHKPYFLPLK